MTTLLDQLRHESRQRTEKALAAYRELLGRLDDLDGAADLDHLKNCMATLDLSEAHVEADRAALAEAQAKARDVPSDEAIEALAAQEREAAESAKRQILESLTAWLSGLDLARLAAFCALSAQALPDGTFSTTKAAHENYRRAAWRLDMARQQQQNGQRELAALHAANPRVFSGAD